MMTTTDQSIGTVHKGELEKSKLNPKSVVKMVIKMEMSAGLAKDENSISSITSKMAAKNGNGWDCKS